VITPVVPLIVELWMPPPEPPTWRLSKTLVMLSYRRV